MQTIYKHRNKILVAIMILMLLPFVFNIGLESDEPFSMAIINHSYESIISLTTMDIHPPLYYLVLKAFLSITTFWTSSIFIKIIFARILSLLFTLIVLYYLIKVLQILKIHYNSYVVAFIFFVCPVVYTGAGIASSIRMYSLGTMLCTICFYYLMLYKEDSKLKYLLFICLSVTLTLYTQYLIGMIAGLYILSILIILLINKKYNSFIKLLVTAIISLVLYIPWVPKIITQFSAQSTGKNVDVLALGNIKYVIIHYAVVLFLGLILIFSKKIKLSNDVKLIILINILIVLIILMVNAKFNPYSISVRYMSIALIIDYVIIGNVIFHNLGINIVKMLCIAFVIPLLYINGKNEIPVQLRSEMVPSIQFYNEFKSIKDNSKNIVDAKKYNLDKYNWNVQGGNAVYLQSINKKVYYDKSLKFSVYYAVGNGNVKLFKSLFPNIKGYSTKPYFK